MGIRENTYHERTLTCCFSFVCQRLNKLITPDLKDKEANQKVLLSDVQEKTGDEVQLTSTL